MCIYYIRNWYIPFGTCNSQGPVVYLWYCCNTAVTFDFHSYHDCIHSLTQLCMTFSWGTSACSTDWYLVMVPIPMGIRASTYIVFITLGCPVQSSAKPYLIFLKTWQPKNAEKTFIVTINVTMYIQPVVRWMLTVGKNLESVDIRIYVCITGKHLLFPSHPHFFPPTCLTFWGKQK